jgi:hypothetical protein
MTMINKGISLGIGAVSLAVAVALAGCGSGGGGTPTASNNSITGVITGFGSVYVNGVEYDTSRASYSVDGVAGSSDYDLDVGMRVSLQGTVNADGVTGTASSIHYADELEGVLMGVPNVQADGTGTLEIMGQTVTLSQITVFHSNVAGISAVTDIVAGNVVEVSGHSDGMGNIVASRIEVKAPDLATYLLNNPGGLIELKGKISSNDPAASTFQIGSLIVDYSGASLDNLPADPGSWDGLYVEVKSDSSPVDNNDGTFTLTAMRVELEGNGKTGINAVAGAEVELRGMIMAISSPTDFMLDGQAVTITAGSDSPEAGKITTVDATMIGRMVEVEGYIDASGTLVSHEVGLEDGYDASLTTYRDYVQSIDTSSGTVTLQGGQVISVTNNTIMQDGLSSNADHYFNLSDLRTSDYLEVHAYTDPNGNLVAAKLEREDAPVI